MGIEVLALKVQLAEIAQQKTRKVNCLPEVHLPQTWRYAVMSPSLTQLAKELSVELWLGLSPWIVQNPGKTLPFVLGSLASTS